MSISGKTIRLNRIFNPKDGKAVCVAADHGFMSGPTENVIKLRGIVEKVVRGGADGILLSPGQAVRLGDLLRGRNAPALLLRADWMTGARLGGLRDKDMKFLPVKELKRTTVAKVSDVLRLGASAVTIYFFFGYDDEFESQNLESCAIFARECSRQGLPCIIEPIIIGGLVTGANRLELQKIAARMAVEIGADVLKIQYTFGDRDFFREVAKAAGVPLLILGGTKSDDERVALEMVVEALESGASGVVFGRNVTKAKDPEDMVKKIRAIVHEGKTVEELIKLEKR